MTSSLVRAIGGPLPFGRRRPASAATRLPLVALALLLLTQAIGPAQGASAAPPAGDGVVTLTGEVTVTSPYVLGSRSDPYVMLRNVWTYYGDDETPAGRQILAGLEGDVAEGAEYALSLPIAPAGMAMDVDWDEEDRAGVKIYEVVLVSDAIGDPFFGPYEGSWGTGVSSLLIDWDTYVWSGKLVVWTPDDEQLFPTSAGEDEQLFTEDDPLERLEAGWTVVDLDGEEFAFERDETVDVPLLEALDSHIDLSDLDYVGAFDELVDYLGTRYAFKDAKDIDFDAMVEEIRPEIVEAERENDPEAFHVAMLRFATMFGDGHVGIGLASEYFDDYLDDRYGGSLGLAVGETDESELIVVTVAPGSPAAEAGIEPGAEILEWDGDAPDEALEAVDLMRGESSPHGLRAQQVQLLPRLPVGEEIELVVRNPGERSTEAIELGAVADPDGLAAIRMRRAANPAELPVTASVLPSGVGYIRVNTFFSDVALTFDAWEWAMNRMIELDLPALVIDVRGNGGGWMQTATYFAGSFIEERFVLAEDYFADAEGEFQEAGRIVVEPSPIRWEKPVAILIDADCASACEIFSAAMAHDREHLVVGETPTAGVEAGVMPWTLPHDLYFQASVMLMLDEEGEVFLEGAGVPPTIDVEVTSDSLLSDEDEVLLAADEALLEQVEER
jgi:C-terminal processing protease CtpA/Prc